jgi:hypothetical protein
VFEVDEPAIVPPVDRITTFGSELSRKRARETLACQLSCWAEISEVFLVSLRNENVCEPIDRG